MENKEKDSIPRKMDAFGGLKTHLDVFRKNLDIRQAFTSLHYPNYRLWFWSNMFSLFGSWMQSTALGFLAYDLTRSAAFLGLVGFASGIPTWLFTLYAGVIADRVSKRNMIVVTQITMACLAVAISIMAFLHLVEPWHLVVMALLMGTANAVEAPARQAFVLEMVAPQDLTNAIALNGAMFNTATAVGPAVGGITYALFGPAWCFAINAFSFIPVITALRMMKLPPNVPCPKGGSPTRELKEGLSYTLNEPIIRTVIALVGVVTIFGMSFLTLLPAWAVKILHGNATTNGFLQSSRGLGALIAALIIASLGKFKFHGKLLMFGAFMLPVSLVLFSFITWEPLSIILLIGVGMSLVLVYNLANAIVQTAVPNRIRGRIMSIYSLTFLGTMPIGSLMMGALAQKFGEQATALAGGLIVMVGSALIFYLVPLLKEFP